MEWLAEEPTRGKIALSVLVLLITGLILWFGRKSLGTSIACALAFLFIAAMSGPSIIPARPIAQRNACIANLRSIEAAKKEWATQNHKSLAHVPQLADLFSTNNLPVCPGGGTYKIGAISEKPTCSLASKRHTLE
jgi:hypothetical protein